MAEMCDSSRECQATRSRASDGEKDYAGMRDMQRKFIAADHELRALKEEFAEVEKRADDAVKARDVLLGQIFDQQNATAVKDKGWSETVCVAREQRDEADARADKAERKVAEVESREVEAMKALTQYHDHEYGSAAIYAGLYGHNDPPDREWVNPILHKFHDATQKKGTTT